MERVFTFYLFLFQLAFSPWSDNSPEWQMLSSGAKKDMGLTFAHDGEFWYYSGRLNLTTSIF